MIAFFRAVFKVEMGWIKTPKFGNMFIFKIFSSLFRKK